MSLADIIDQLETILSEEGDLYCEDGEGVTITRVHYNPTSRTVEVIA